MKKLLTLIKNNKIKTGILAAIVVIIVLIATKGPKEVQREYVTVGKTTVVQEVDVTGRVEPASEVALAVQAGGKVSAVPARVGQMVRAGQLLVRVNTADLQVRLERQQAALEKAQIVLTKQAPKTDAHDDLVKAYEDGFNAVADTFLDLPSIVTGLDDIPDHDYLAENTISAKYGSAARDFRDDAERQYYLAKDAYDTVLKEYKSANRQSDPATIESLIVETYDATRVVADAVKKMNTFIDYIENKMEEGTRPTALQSDQAALDAFTTQTNGHLNTLLSIKDTIKNSRLGITDENYDIESITIDIRQAELDIADTMVQINNRSIYSPIDGVVTTVEATVGETISSGAPVVSVISNKQYQVTANLPESEMAKVTVGAAADVVLDAYGDSVPFAATVVAIDPAGTLLDGVATYKTTFQFAENDDRIKSGMTADINIKGERREDVLAVPARAVITKEGGKYVQVVVGEELVEKAVETGLRGTDGNIEIISGLAEGDKVVVFVETK